MDALEDNAEVADESADEAFEDSELRAEDASEETEARTEPVADDAVSVVLIDMAEPEVEEAMLVMLEPAEELPPEAAAQIWAAIVCVSDVTVSWKAEIGRGEQRV